LRAHELGDFEPSLAMWRDPIVTRYIGGKPSTEQQTWSRLVNYRGHWALMGFGYWAVEDKANSEFIGEIGFADFKRNIDARMRDVPELGWAFASSVHGRGYAAEAVRAVGAWGDANLESLRTVCLIHADNLASVRVAEKSGYRPFERTLLAERPTIFFQRLSGET
jgi:RimJ/RimL family protein N-acetyltransferase